MLASQLEADSLEDECENGNIDEKASRSWSSRAVIKMLLTLVCDQISHLLTLLDKLLSNLLASSQVPAGVQGILFPRLISHRFSSWIRYPEARRNSLVGPMSFTLTRQNLKNTHDRHIVSA